MSPTAQSTRFATALIGAALAATALAPGAAAHHGTVPHAAETAAPATLGQDLRSPDARDAARARRARSC